MEDVPDMVFMVDPSKEQRIAVERQNVTNWVSQLLRLLIQIVTQKKLIM